MDYRSVPESHREAFFDAVRYAFRPEDGPAWERPDDDEDRPRPMTLRGMYDADPATPDAELSADDLHATGGYYDFTTRIRDDWHTAGGVSVVTADPTIRRSGVVATMLDEMLAEFRDEGVDFSVLWPFEYDFYRRFGWAKSNDTALVTLPPEALAAVAPDPAGEFVRLTADDWETVESVRDEWATEALAVRRSEAFWRYRIFDSWQSDPYAYGWERDGELRGYLVYRVEEGEGDDGKTMAVTELAGVDREATDHLYRFCRNHDSQVESVRIRLPVDTSLLDRLTDPRAADVEIRPGPMVRIVDVARALSALSYPAGVSTTVTLSVSDPRCDWNEGRFELSVADGSGTVTWLTETSEAGADAHLGVGPLSQLAVGSLSASELASYGDVAGPDRDAPAEQTVETLAALFPKEPVYLREGF
ncbi:GNAT family N-acetyltransferase [Salinirubrum litoreum]|uniref:Enhanced intracellular survival protein Eis n=1 Tax=Salinirubrum litoreum TaxID=1126234 RepID=A0ABD5REW4_9EURY|nr:GNAT family N-acetyltransferase [Salinirubrum litoreum]